MDRRRAATVLMLCALFLLAGLLLAQCGRGEPAKALPTQHGGGDLVFGTVALGGDVSTPLHPGLRVPVDLWIENPTDRAVRISAVTVQVRAVRQREAASSPDRSAPPVGRCRARDFAGHPLLTTHGVVIGPRQRWVATEADPQVAQLPALELVETGVNQDACQGVTVTVGYQARYAKDLR